MKGRADALGILVPYAREQMGRLSDDVETIELAYRPALSDTVENDLPIDGSRVDQPHVAGSQRGPSAEIGAGVTLVGPHRDDVEVLIDGLPAASFASRAQLRTAALSLRFAEAATCRPASVMSPWSSSTMFSASSTSSGRRGVLDSFDIFQQVIVTTVDPDRVRDVLTTATGRFVVSGGAIGRFEGE